MDENFNKHLGNKLKLRRLALGLTQTKVAKAINVTFQQIQKYEKGTNGVSSIRLLQLSNYLKVPINELRRRDPKQIYDRYDKGEITNVAGLDLPIDEHYAADLILEFEKNRSIESLVTEIANKIDTTQKQDNKKITI